jgi:hypothetical protein
LGSSFNYDNNNNTKQILELPETARKTWMQVHAPSSHVKSQQQSTAAYVGDYSESDWEHIPTSSESQIRQECWKRILNLDKILDILNQSPPTKQRNRDGEHAGDFGLSHSFTDPIVHTLSDLENESDLFSNSHENTITNTSTNSSDTVSTSLNPFTHLKDVSVFWRLVHVGSIHPEFADMNCIINKDVPRTRNHYHAFNDNKRADELLKAMLIAYAVHDPEVGYCQGMNFVAAFLLCKFNGDPVLAYAAFYSVLNSETVNLRVFFMKNLSGVLICQEQFQQLLRRHLPKLHLHFQIHEFLLGVFTEWFMTIFIARGYSDELISRIWDLILIDGHKAILRVALAIMYRSQRHVLRCDSFESIYLYFKQEERKIELDPDTLIGIATKFKVTNSLLRRMRLPLVST